MEREHPERFQDVLTNIAEKIPGIDKIDTQMERTSDGRLLLRFNDKGVQDSFYAQQVSDGTLKVFAYLLLLGDPSPPPFLFALKNRKTACIISSWRLWPMSFANTPMLRAARRFLSPRTSHTLSTLLSRMKSGFWKRARIGFSTIRRASEDPIVNNMVAEGLPLGGLWYSDYFDER